MAESAALTLRGISYAYPRAATAVSAVELEAKPGEVTCLLGPSGCGKSTLLKLIAGFLSPQQGEIHLNGTCLANARASTVPEARSIGLVLQHATLFPHLTALKNVAFGVKAPRAARRNVAQEWLEKMHISHLHHHYPHAMSGGEQQRVAIARALASSPSLLLMDEPFSSLDAVLRRHLRQECRQLLTALHIPVLMVTHDARDALALADKVYVMETGRIIHHGTLEEVRRQPITLIQEMFAA